MEHHDRRRIRLGVVFRPASAVAAPPLRAGDRVIPVDGRPFRAGWEVSRRAEALGPYGTMHVVVARGTPGGAVEQMDSTIAISPMPRGRTTSPVVCSP